MKIRKISYFQLKILLQTNTTQYPLSVYKIKFKRR